MSEDYPENKFDKRVRPGMSFEIEDGDGSERGSWELSASEREGAREFLSAFIRLYEMNQWLDQNDSSKDSSEKELKYEVFPDPQERREIIEIGREVSEYLHDNKITKVGIMDRSARPAYITITENWKRMYPDQKPPQIYFLNPKGFVSQEMLDNDPELFDNMNMEAMYKGDKRESRFKVRSQDEIDQDLADTFPDMVDSKSGPVFIFDNCMHSGDTLRPVVDTLRHVGAKVKVGLVASDRGKIPDWLKTGIRTDMTVMDHTPRGVCYPFDKDRMVNKTFGSVHSDANHDPDSIEASRIIRKEIRSAIKEYYGEEK